MADGDMPPVDKSQEYEKRKAEEQVLQAQPRLPAQTFPQFNMKNVHYPDYK